MTFFKLKITLLCTIFRTISSFSCLRTPSSTLGEVKIIIVFFSIPTLRNPLQGLSTYDIAVKTFMKMNDKLSGDATLSFYFAFLLHGGQFLNERICS